MATREKSVKIVCIGAGYVGGPTMAVIAQQCPEVRITVFDIAQSRIDAWNSPAPKSEKEGTELPIYEPGLSEIVYKVRNVNLFFSTDRSVLQDADIIFVAVNTPTKENGIGAGCAADLSYIESSARMIAETCTSGHHIVVEKSTVPVRCSVSLARILQANCPSDGTVSYSILSNPEFLAEGTAIRDLLDPDRVLIGGDDADAIETLAKIYAHWVPRERIVTANLWSSELSKLVANAFLAQRISSINSITALCERTGADVQEVKDVISRDKRIGPHFLQPSIGFGGSCFQKDILNLVYLCESFGLSEVASYWQQVVSMNDYHKERFYKKVIHTCFDTVRSKIIAVYGFAFKKDTGDTRESAAIYVCCRLLQEGALLNIYDPKVSAEAVFMELEHFVDINHIHLPHIAHAGASDESKGSWVSAYLRRNVHIKTSAVAAAEEASAVLILTEWDEFRDMDYTPVYRCMRKPAFVFDGRLVLDREKMMRIGFNVYSIGKPTSDPFFAEYNSQCERSPLSPVPKSELQQYTIHKRPNKADTASPASF